MADKMSEMRAKAEARAAAAEATAAKTTAQARRASIVRSVAEARRASVTSAWATDPYACSAVPELEGANTDFAEAPPPSQTAAPAKGRRGTLVSGSEGSLSDRLNRDSRVAAKEAPPQPLSTRGASRRETTSSHDNKPRTATGSVSAAAVKFVSVSLMSDRSAKGDKHKAPKENEPPSKPRWNIGGARKFGNSAAAAASRI